MRELTDKEKKRLEYLKKLYLEIKLLGNYKKYEELKEKNEKINR